MAMGIVWVDVVEVNSSFYAIPSPHTTAAWVEHGRGGAIF